MEKFETRSKCWSANFKRRHDNTIMDVKEIGCDVEWILLVQYSKHDGLPRTCRDLRVSRNVDNFLVIWGNTAAQKRPRYMGVVMSSNTRRPVHFCVYF